MPSGEVRSERRSHIMPPMTVAQAVLLQELVGLPRGPGADVLLEGEHGSSLFLGDGTRIAQVNDLAALVVIHSVL